MLTIVTFKWQPTSGYRSKFEAEHVIALQRMVAKHYALPHRFLCITDDTSGLKGLVETMPLWADLSYVRNPHGMHQPSCYRRLKLFSKEAADFVGPRFVCLDLDTVIVGDMTPLWERTEDFVIWGETNPKSFYNGSMFMLRAGTRTKVWETFDPSKSPMLAKRAGRFGSDQGWISHCLGRGEAMWGKKDGVYSYRVHIAPKGNILPADARIVMFHGKHDPWQYQMQQVQWIREHYGAPEGVAA